MSVDEGAPPVRKLRADGVRNRERLVEAAKAAFTETGPGVSLDEIARRAGVGIGTLYRHFPARDALVEAVYRRELEQMAGTAPRLLETLRPGDALHEWLRQLVAYIAAKKVIVAALESGADGASTLYAASGSRIPDALELLVERARSAGDIRAEAESADLMRAMIGFSHGAAGPGWEASALRLTDILMDGLRQPARGERA